MPEAVTQVEPKTRKKRTQKNKVGANATTVKEQTLHDYSEGGKLKYRCDFPSWEEYKKYLGEKK